MNLCVGVYVATKIDVISKYVTAMKCPLFTGSGNLQPAKNKNRNANRYTYVYLKRNINILSVLGSGKSKHDIQYLRTVL